MKKEKIKSEKEATSVELQIRNPEMDKNFMITFEGKNQKECAAYNQAILEVLDRGY